MLPRGLRHAGALPDLAPGSNASHAPAAPASLRGVSGGCISEGGLVQRDQRLRPAERRRVRLFVVAAAPRPPDWDERLRMRAAARQIVETEFDGSFSF